MRDILNAIIGSPHAEERPKGASRSTYSIIAARLPLRGDLLHSLKGARALAVVRRLHSRISRPLRVGVRVLGFGFNRSDMRLALNFVKIGLQDRFLGSSLGAVWGILNPLILLGLFTVIFGFVFNSKLPGATTSIGYVIWLISGYGPWLAISDSMSAATLSIVGNVGLVKNLMFKTELLPIAATLIGMVPLLVATVYLSILFGLDGRTPTYHWLVILPVIVCQFMFVAGIGLVLAALNVFVRDVGVILPNVLLVLLFASPIFYPLTTFPPGVQHVLQLNPFYVLSEGYRQPILNDRFPPVWELLYLVGAAFASFTVGLRFFRRMKSHFDGYL
jgi:lipopolysaccharide transport system permease protein